MLQGLQEEALNARRMAVAIIGSAFMPGEPFENSEHAGVAQRGQDGERGGECLAIESGELVEVAGDHFLAELPGHITAGVFEK